MNEYFKMFTCTGSSTSAGIISTVHSVAGERLRTCEHAVHSNNVCNWTKILQIHREWFFLKNSTSPCETNPSEQGFRLTLCSHGRWSEAQAPSASSQTRCSAAPPADSAWWGRRACRTPGCPSGRIWGCRLPGESESYSAEHDLNAWGPTHTHTQIIKQLTPYILTFHTDPWVRRITALWPRLLICRNTLNFNTSQNLFSKMFWRQNRKSIHEPFPASSRRLWLQEVRRDRPN